MFAKYKNIFLQANNRYWLRFLINGLVIIIIVLLFYGIFRKNEFIDKLYVDGLNYLASFLLWVSKGIISLLGYEVVTYGKTIKIIDSLTTHGVYLDRGCMGRNVMIGFSALIIAFPGNFKHKLWYIPMGIAVLIFINIARISGLAITAHCCPEYSNVNHHVIFKYTAWSVIVVLWIIWFNKFNPLKNRPKKINTQDNT